MKKMSKIISGLGVILSLMGAGCGGNAVPNAGNDGWYNHLCPDSAWATEVSFHEDVNISSFHEAYPSQCELLHPSLWLFAANTVPALTAPAAEGPSELLLKAGPTGTDSACELEDCRVFSEENFSSQLEINPNLFSNPLSEQENFFSTQEDNSCVWSPNISCHVSCAANDFIPAEMEIVFSMESVSLNSLTSRDYQSNGSLIIFSSDNADFWSCSYSGIVNFSI